MRVTVVIPALNEAGNIGRLALETIAVMPPEALAEIIVVDDASEDGTGEEVKALLRAEAHAGLRYMRHERRSGQSAALRTGVMAATSPIIATLDGDGQNDPADIPTLLAKLAAPGTKGPALVSGVRTNRKAEGSKRWASKAANAIRAAVLKDDCPDTGCGIKVYWREAFLRLPFFTSMHRYLPALFQTYGYEVAYAPVNDRPRLAGRSKYTNLGRALIGVYDLIGVTWLRRRTVTPTIAEALPERGQVSDLASRFKARGEGPKKSAGDKN